MAGGKNRETVTASLCLMFKGRGRNFAPALIESINSLFPGEKATKWKSSRERETASFCSPFNADPPRLETDRRSKAKQSPGNSSEIDAILD